MEIAAHNSYNEVDFVLGGGEVAIEVKGAARVEKRDLRPLTAFVEEYSRGYMPYPFFFFRLLRGLRPIRLLRKSFMTAK